MYEYKIALVPLGVAGRHLANFCIFFYLSRQMSIEDFGITSLGLSIINSIGGVVTLALASGFGRYFYEINEHIKQTIIIFVTIVGLILSLLVYCIFLYFDVMKLKEFALLIVAAAYLNALSDFWLLSSRLRKEFILFAIYNVATVFVLVGGIFFLADKLNPRNVFFAYLIQALPFASLLVINSYKKVGGDLKIALRSEKIRKILRYSLFILPGNLGYFLNNSGDKLILSSGTSEAELAIYSFIYQIPIILAFAYITIIKTVIGPIFFESTAKNNIILSQNKAFATIDITYVVVCLLLVIFAREGVDLINSEYRRGIQYLPLLLLAGYFSILSNLYVLSIHEAGKTYIDTAIELSAGVISLFACIFLIPTHVIYGAVLATVTGFGVRCMMYMLASIWLDGKIKLRLKSNITVVIIFLMCELLSNER